jgi:uncharacterized caspase-like protein
VLEYFAQGGVEAAMRFPIVARRVQFMLRAGSAIACFAVGFALWSVEANAASTPQVPEPPALPAWAQAQKPPPKKALIIGIDNYQFASALTTPAFDADMIAASLKKLDPGFDIRTVPTNQRDRKGLLDAFEAYSASLKEGDVAFVFYSGHGLERNGVNYLVPADARLAEAGREGFEYISIDYLNGLLEKTKAGIVVLILDACRTDPFAGGATQSDLLDPPDPLPVVAQATAQVATGTPTQQPAPEAQPPAGLRGLDLPQGFIAVYAAAPGKPSFSLFKGESPTAGSIFTRRLVNFLATINKSIHAVFNVTSGDVFALTKTRQKPFVSTFNGGEILLQANDNLAEDEYETWTRVANSPADQMLSALTSFVSMYPAGSYTAVARAKIQELSSGTTVAVAFEVVNPPSDFVLSGALQSAPVQTTRLTTAVAQRSIFVRASPFSDTAKISRLQRGEEVQIVDGAARPGWAKVLLQSGTIGYVGSVDALPIAPVSPTLSVTVAGNDAMAASGAIDEAWRKSAMSSTLVINVNPAVDENPWRARQQAFLAGLRLRDAVVAEGVRPSRLAFTIGRPLNAAGEISMSIIGGARR